MNINHAILHILDFDSSVNVMSQRELELDTRAAKSFVATHLRRARTSADNRRGSFSPESGFAPELKAFLFGERDFIDLSQQVAEFLAAELAKAEKPESTDVLVADFEDDDDVRWFAVLLLSSRQAFMHEVGREGGEVANAIKRHYAILPNPSQKLASYALVRASSTEIFYQDKPRKIGGMDTLLIPQGLLQCDEGTSGKEAIEAVTRAVAQAAEDHGANAAVAVAAVKSAVANAVEEDEDLPPWDVVDVALADEPQLRDAAKEALASEGVPEHVPVERHQVERAAVKSHRIRTDTGITITFPVDMVGNPNYVEFVNEPNGLISIELKQIGSIENR